LLIGNTSTTSPFTISSSPLSKTSFVGGGGGGSANDNGDDSAGGGGGNGNVDENLKGQVAPSSSLPPPIDGGLPWQSVVSVSTNFVYLCVFFFFFLKFIILCITIFFFFTFLN
jgi:hypothetical protein